MFIVMDRWWLWVVVGYLCGAIPFSLLIGLARGVDIRRVGSGNVGATNLGRALGRPWGWGCFALDTAKGLVPVLIAGRAMGLLGVELAPVESWKWLAVAVAAVVGHVFPVWLKFRGGKGVATGLGALMGFWPILTIPAGVAVTVWIVLVVIFRYVSLASMAAAIAIPPALLVTACVRQQSPTAIVPFLLTTTLLAVLVVARHGSNVKRLVAGTESKIGE